MADPSGVTSTTISAIDNNNLDLFLKKDNFRHYSEGMAENTKLAVVKIDDIKSGSWYLGIKNPSSLNGINICIEVVAVIENRIIKKN